MPRIRTIKPEYWSSPLIGELEFDTRLLFIALWNWADDYGRGTANPRELAGFAFPHDENVTARDIRRMLGGIRRVFGVEFYTVDGRQYYAIPTWDEHQKIDKRSKQRHPAPEDGEPFDPDRVRIADQGKEQLSTEPAESSPSPRRTPDDGTEEQGNRGTEEQGKKTRSRDVSKSEPDGFAEFWSAYPRKVGKKAARTAYEKALHETDAATILEGARRYAAAQRERDPKYTAHPTTWLNRGSWDDEPEPVYTPPAEVSTKDQRIARLQALKSRFPEEQPPDDARTIRALPSGGVA